ncbi:MAG: hypothetical protein ACKPKO_14595, partial [Candidatus Fonsibacter sp.]
MTVRHIVEYIIHIKQQEEDTAQQQGSSTRPTARKPRHRKAEPTGNHRRRPEGGELETGARPKEGKAVIPESDHGGRQEVARRELQPRESPVEVQLLGR